MPAHLDRFDSFSSNFEHFIPVPGFSKELRPNPVWVRPDTQLCDNDLMKFSRLVSSLLFFILIGSTMQAPAQNAGEDGLLPIEEAFRVQAQAVDRDTVRLDWKLAEHYYLYRDRIKVT